MLTYNGKTVTSGNGRIVVKPVVLPPYTVRVKFSNAVDPTQWQYAEGVVLTQVSASPNIWDVHYEDSSWYASYVFPWTSATTYEVIGGNLTGVTKISFARSTITDVKNLDTSMITDMSMCFHQCQEIVDAPMLDTSNVTNFGMFFDSAYNLETCPVYDTSKATNMSSMFHNCTSLTEIPSLDTSNVTNFATFASNCESLRHVPLLDVSSAVITDGERPFDHTFSECVNVESGSYAMYQAMLARETAVGSQLHYATFNNCGSDTVTGAAELAQIPASWGGTA